MPFPRSVRPGGASGAWGRLALVRPSAFPGQATNRVFLTSPWPWRAWPQYCSGSCSLAVFGRGPCSALVCLCGFVGPSWFLREQAAGVGGRALLRPPSRAPRSCRGEGGSPPLPRRGWGPAPPWLAGRCGGWGDRGRSRRGSPPPSLGEAACGPLLSSPFVARASLSGVCVQPGSWSSPGRRVRPAAGGPAWRGGGGGGGGP